MKYRIPEVIWLKTKYKVVEVLKTYNYYALSLIGEKELEINQDYKMKIKIVKNETFNIRTKKHLKRKALLNHVIESYNKLKVIDRKIIYYTYFSESKVNDDIIANTLGFSVKYYYKLKKEAIIKLAFALGVEVLRGDEDN